MNLENRNVFKDINKFENFSLNIIYCDSPYNLSSVWKINPYSGAYEVKRKTKDFMSKWEGLDHNELDLFFEDSFRVLKHGGFCIMFGMDRQLAPFQYYALKNGFEVQQSLYWYFISNFPKVTKMGGKFKNYKYSKTPFKQVVETIMVFRKPTKTGSTLKDVLAWQEGDEEISPAVINIEGSRVPAGSNEYVICHYKKEDCFQNLKSKESKFQIKKQPSGRYPSQLFINELTTEVLDKQNENCSRINHICNYEQEELDLLLYHSKVNRSEREYGLNGLKNNHPTVKPIKLNKEILTLFKLPDEVNQRIYIPFSGVGSEIIGAIFAGFNFNYIYACEGNEEFFNISEVRVKAWKKLYEQGYDFKQPVRVEKNNKKDMF